jgi:hypothetical protein
VATTASSAAVHSVHLRDGCSLVSARAGPDGDHIEPPRVSERGHRKMRLFKHIARRAALPPLGNPHYSAGTKRLPIAPDRPLSGKGNQMAEVREEHLHDYRITSLETFKKATKDQRQIAGLYFYQILDCLIDVAYMVSADFRKRPQHYVDLDPPIAPILAKLNAQYGTEINVLAKSQRNEIYLPIFGSWGGSSSNESDSFPDLRDDLLEAAAAFAEHAEDNGDESLREAVRTAHKPFKDYLLGLQGESVTFSKDVLLEETEDICYRILRNKGVAAAFGYNKQVGGQYPYATDSTGDLLVAEISNQLKLLNITQVYTTGRISTLQRAALRGAEAIATAIDFEEANADLNEEDDDLELLIKKCYTWRTALMSLKGSPKPVESPLQSTVPAPATPVNAPTGLSARSYRS